MCYFFLVRTLCGARADSRGRLIYPRGIVQGAKVVRGPDWEYGMKDGEKNTSSGSIVKFSFTTYVHVHVVWGNLLNIAVLCKLVSQLNNT